MAGLLIAAFLARAPLYLSVFPPLEGWDEYQHLGYIVHLEEARTMPVYDSRVPLSLRPLVISVPHSQWGGEQVQEWGALPYPQYWASGPPSLGADPPSSPRLYQAQHPPLAYVVAVPVWRTFAHRVEAIYAIRAMNLVLVAAALALFAASLPRLLPSLPSRMAVLALVCLHPLFFQNAARVANDGLAMATGIAAMAMLLLADGRTLLRCGVLAAGCMAASIWSKQTGLTLIPALVVGLPLIGWAHGASAGRVGRATGAAIAVLLLLVAPLWSWNYEQYGSIITTQESIELANRGAVVEALMAAATTLNWGALIDTLFVPGRPWVGGWSFLAMNDALTRVYAWLWSALLVAALAGAATAALWRSRSAASRDQSPPAARASTAAMIICALVVVFMAAGMIHHALVSQAVAGRSNTNPWYFMTALPFLFVLLARGWERLDRRLPAAAGAALAVVFVVIDVHGTWSVMPQAYAATADPALQWSRLTSIHPSVLSGDLRWLFLGAQFGALALAGGAVRRGVRAPR